MAPPMASAPRRRKAGTVFGYNLCVPGALMPAVLRRMAELKSGNLSRYVTELIAFDLRRLRAHTLTGPLAHKPLPVQHAVDLAIDGHFVVGKKSNKAEMDALVRRGPSDAAALGEIAPVKAVKERVWLRALHREAMKQRAAALGFRSLGEYIISLIRFDLLLGGPHEEFPGDKEFTRAEIAAMDEWTLATCLANQPKKCMVDYVVEEVAGRELTREERDAELAKVAERICEQAVEKHRKARRGKG
jgi:hypothetical protein